MRERGAQELIIIKIDFDLYTKKFVSYY